MKSIKIIEHIGIEFTERNIKFKTVQKIIDLLIINQHKLSKGRRDIEHLEPCISGIVKILYREMNCLD